MAEATVDASPAALELNGLPDTTREIVESLRRKPTQQWILGPQFLPTVPATLEGILLQIPKSVLQLDHESRARAFQLLDEEQAVLVHLTYGHFAKEFAAWKTAQGMHGVQQALELYPTLRPAFFYCAVIAGNLELMHIILNSDIAGAFELSGESKEDYLNHVHVFAFRLAVIYNQVEAVEYLLDHPRWIEVTVADFLCLPMQLAMEAAASKGKLGIVQILHRHYSVEELEKDNSPLAMDVAVAYGQLSVVKFLHENGFHGCSDSAVRLASEKKFTDVVEYVELHNLVATSFREDQLFLDSAPESIPLQVFFGDFFYVDIELTEEKFQQWMEDHKDDQFYPM
ncbi:hypothetical protein LEN26_013173 [Aphanomyces euteiches]|nr:hypothetical protein AeMF1_012746 [Aphanomyces euteiches]KAH9113303.1 hypothetical protein LEN26_013173 [Aphanomyces euteiches]KAH9195811.1 hypothetical protein AeNC1_002200 [Aphanomyces euteiches]